MRLKVACLLIALTAFALPAAALSLMEIDANGGMLFIGSVPPEGYGAPNPSIAQLIGLSLPMTFGGPFFLEPVIEMYGLRYEWTGLTAVPANDTSIAGFYTLGGLISLQAGLRFPVSAKVSLGGSLGLDFLFRFPAELKYNDPISIAGREPSMGYFYGQGRFFNPETRLFMHWQVSDSVSLLVNLRAYYPLFHLWDGLQQPFIDQFMFSAGVGFGFRLGAAAAP